MIGASGARPTPCGGQPGRCPRPEFSPNRGWDPGSWRGWRGPRERPSCPAPTQARPGEKYKSRVGGGTLRLRSRVGGCVQSRQIPGAGRSFLWGRTRGGWSRSLPPACFPNFPLPLGFSEGCPALCLPPPGPPTSPIPNQRRVPRTRARTRRLRLRPQRDLTCCGSDRARPDCPPGLPFRCLYSVRRRQGHALFMEQQRHLSLKEGHTGTERSFSTSLPRKKCYPSFVPSLSRTRQGERLTVNHGATRIITHPPPQLLTLAAKPGTGQHLRN